MIDLTHYANRNNAAAWVTPPSRQPEIWLWLPGQPDDFPLSLETIDAFTVQGWEDVGLGLEDNGVVYVLCGQLADVRLVTTDEGVHVWTASADRKRAEGLPVMLAFKMTPEQQKRAEQHRRAEERRFVEQQNPSPKQPYSIQRQPLPPTNFGELALIAIKEDSLWRGIRCSIGSLPKESQQLQQRMGAALSRLEASDTLEHAAWLIQWKEIQGMAQELARNYWSTYEATQRVERPHVSNVFKDGFALAALNMHVQGLHTAMYHKNNWEEEPGMLPSYTHQFGSGYTKTWLREPGQEGINGDLASEELTKHLAGLSDLEADIVTIQIAQAMSTSNEKGETALTPEAILEYRGIKPKVDGHGYRAGHRAEDIQTIIEAFERTAWLRLKVWQQIKRRNGKDIEISEQSSYILVESRIFQNPLDESSPGRLLAWNYRMGKWLAPFMDENQAGRYFGRVMKKTLEYDYYRQTWEKRLSRYFNVHLIIAAKEGTAHIKRHVGKLLEECGVKLNTDNPQWNKDRFEKALRQLVSDGIIGDWKYTEERELPARQWLPIWLDRIVTVTVASGALEAGYQEMIDHAKERRALPMPQKLAGKGTQPKKRQGG